MKIIDPVTIRLPWPSPKLSPNARIHWGARSRATKAARREAELLAVAAGAKRLRGSPLIKAGITFIPPDGRRRDDDNMISSFKAQRDGIASAIGVDDSLWLTQYIIGPCQPGGAIIMTLEAGE